MDSYESKCQNVEKLRRNLDFFPKSSTNPQDLEPDGDFPDVMAHTHLTKSFTEHPDD